MCAHHLREIDRTFSKNGRRSTAPALAVVALFATLTMGCRSVVESNGIPSTLTLAVTTSVGTGSGEVILAEATLLSTTGAPVTGVDVLFEADSATFAPGPVVTTNDMGIAAVTVQTSTPGSVRASALDGLITSNPVQLNPTTVVEETVTLSVTFESDELTAQSATKIIFLAEGTGGAELEGELTVRFGDRSGALVFTDFSRRRVVSHAWAEPGTYELSAVLVLKNGDRATGRMPVVVDKGTSNDAIDLSTVVFLHANVSRWPATSEITGVRIREQDICMFHTKAHSWPVLNTPVAIYGNPWVIAKIDGTWYAGTFEWMRPGQECKAVGHGEGTLRDRIGLGVELEPLESWKPKKGEMVGLMYSTFARGSERSINERSNVVLVPWPF